MTSETVNFYLMPQCPKPIAKVFLGLNAGSTHTPISRNKKPAQPDPTPSTLSKSLIGILALWFAYPLKRSIVSREQRSPLQCL